MNYFIWIIVLVASYLIGSFGFCQIVGTIKYFKNFSIGSALLTIILWLAILSFGVYAVCSWLQDYIIPTCIGYGITFLLSFKTTPDN